MASKGHRGLGMEGFIARQYDKSARRDMMDLYRGWAQKLAEHLSPDDHVLEVAPGPGYLAIELAKLRPLRITALEISRTFVDIARSNAREAGAQIDIQQGDASAMPFSSDTFDFLMCTSSFKNFSRPQEVLNEMCRVLEPGAEAWISDLRHDVSDATIDTFVRDTLKIRGFSGWFMRYTFKHTLRPRALSRPQFEALIAKTPFRRFEISENPVDFDILLRK